MIDILSRNFLQNKNETSACEILKYLRTTNNLVLCSILGEFFENLFPHSLNVKEECAFSYYYLQKYDKAYSIYSKILEMKGLDDKMVQLSLFNQHFSINHVSDKYINYDRNIINKIQNRPKRPFQLLTFTITTCKRFDLFEKTMNSFLNCVDIENIDNWFLVDDNSSEEDRQKMMKFYPFFTFYFKSIEEKGHANSMNIIRNKVLNEFKTPYTLHIEDDWKFFDKRPYIQDAYIVLDHDKSIGQCLFNKNYTEIESDISVKGGDLRTANSGLRYYVHEYANTPQKIDEWVKKHGNSPSSYYWPHFSFRPSLIRSEVFKKVGEYNKNASHFEMEYAHRYVQNGYISAFFELLTCIHIGRLTSQKFDKNAVNAYTLNSEDQFVKKSNDTSLTEKGTTNTPVSETDDSSSTPANTPVSETDDPITPVSETDNSVTPVNETNDPITPVSETDNSVTPVNETNDPITPVSETDNSVTPVNETNDPITPVSKTDDPVNYENETIDPIYQVSDESDESDEFDTYNNNNIEKYDIPTFVINLDRREDRWANFTKIAKGNIDFLNYKRFRAIDGQKLKSSHQLQRIFDNNDYNMCVGMVGCFLSHLKLYTQLINSDSNAYCILEDDIIEYTPDFEKKYLYIMEQVKGTYWDILFLGHHPRDVNNINYKNTSVMPNVEKWNVFKSFQNSIGGTIGYLISKEGAKKLLDFIDETGAINCIDTMMQKSANKLNIYYCTSHLIFSECFRHEKKTDSDIQYEFTSLTIPFDKKIQDEINYYNSINIQLNSMEYNQIIEELTDNKKIYSIYCLTDHNNINNLKNICKSKNIKCYSIENRIIFIINLNLNINRYFHSFKNNNDIYSIDSCLY